MRTKSGGQDRELPDSTARAVFGSPRPVSLHIEELVLHGFPAGDRHRIAAGVERELTRLLARDGLPAISSDASIDRVDAGSFQIAPAAKPENTGAEVARSVFGGLRR